MFLIVWMIFNIFSSIISPSFFTINQNCICFTNFLKQFLGILCITSIRVVRKCFLFISFSDNLYITVFFHTQYFVVIFSLWNETHFNVFFYLVFNVQRWIHRKSLSDAALSFNIFLHFELNICFKYIAFCDLNIVLNRCYYLTICFVVILIVEIDLSH